MLGNYSIKEMIEYGYNWVGMVPINSLWALARYKKGLAVLILYPDGTEAYAQSEDDFSKLKDTVMYGYERTLLECKLISSAIENIRKCNRTEDVTDVLQERIDVWEEVLRLIGFSDEDIKISVDEADINT